MSVSTGLSVDRRRGSTLVLKRALDICLSAVGLVALSPLFAIVALAVRLEDQGPALYRQTRVGLGGKAFQIVKFRSMKVAQPRGSPEITMAGDPRITWVGSFTRRYKIDELPQLWNVLVGEMSLVGPRPETPSLFKQYTREQRTTMLSLRPGVTDWASLLMTDESELLAAAPDPAAFYRERVVPLKCALWQCYRDEIGLRTDLRILAATLWAILAPRSRNPWLSRAAQATFAAVRRALCRL
jgi:lipopolysaccharide/colanic/teichoic acid biosynthesis glycosyltransferase